jgi:uncharacterized membrane protein
MTGEINMSNRSFNLALAGAFATALAMAAAPAFAGEAPAAKEKCYGVATAGHNDCASAGNNSCAGTVKGDYEKGAWKFVPKGTCTSMGVTLKNGTMRHGSLSPIKS